MAQTRKVSRATRLLLIAAGFLLAFGVAEVGLRVFWENPYQQYSPNGVSLLRAHPALVDRTWDRSGIDPEQPSVRFRTDERGYIMPARRFANSSATIVFLGGSTTECLFVAEHLRFPAYVSTLLEAKGLQINSMNFGRSANNVQHSINNLINHVVNDEPEIVVMMHAANDNWALGAGGYEEVLIRTSDAATLPKFLALAFSAKSSLAGLLRHTRSQLRNKKILKRSVENLEKKIPTNEVQSLQSFKPFADRLRAFVGISRSFGIRPVLMTQPNAEFRNQLTPNWVHQSVQAQLNEVIRQVAVEQEVDLIDLVQYLHDHGKSEHKFLHKVFYDGIHLTDYGSTFFAEHIAEQLSEILQGLEKDNSSANL